MTDKKSAGCHRLKIDCPFLEHSAADGLSAFFHQSMPPAAGHYEKRCDSYPKKKTPHKNAL
jgi:hypothetical protein